MMKHDSEHQGQPGVSCVELEFPIGIRSLQEGKACSFFQLHSGVHP